MKNKELISITQQKWIDEKNKNKKLKLLLIEFLKKSITNPKDRIIISI